MTDRWEEFILSVDGAILGIRMAESQVKRGEPLSEAQIELLHKGIKMSDEQLANLSPAVAKLEEMRERCERLLRSVKQ